MCRSTGDEALIVRHDPLLPSRFLSGRVHVKEFTRKNYPAPLYHFLTFCLVHSTSFDFGFCYVNKVGHAACATCSVRGAYPNA